MIRELVWIVLGLWKPPPNSTPRTFFVDEAFKGHM